MKDQTVIVLAAGVVLGAYLLLQNKKKSGTGSGSAPGYTLRINNPAMESQPGYGWQYYTDGTAIDPKGNYYLNGEMVWSPA